MRKKTSKAFAFVPVVRGQNSLRAQASGDAFGFSDLALMQGALAAAFINRLAIEFDIKPNQVSSLMTLQTPPGGAAGDAPDKLESIEEPPTA